MTSKIISIIEDFYGLIRKVNFKRPSLKISTEDCLVVAIYWSYFQIYAVGGRDDCTELSSAERYNPNTNTWSPIVAMMSRRSGVGLAVVNGQLYAVGGFDGTTYLKTIETFDQVCERGNVL